MPRHDVSQTPHTLAWFNSEIEVITEKKSPPQACQALGFPKNCLFPLEDDPSSVSAMLRGRGDNREKLYERFAFYWQNRCPELTEDEIYARYQVYALEIELRIFTMIFKWTSFRSAVQRSRITLLMVSIAMRLNIYELG